MRRFAVESAEHRRTVDRESRRGRIGDRQIDRERERQKRQREQKRRKHFEHRACPQFEQQQFKEKNAADERHRSGPIFAENREVHHIGSGKTEEHAGGSRPGDGEQKHGGERQQRMPGGIPFRRGRRTPLHLRNCSTRSTSRSRTWPSSSMVSVT